MAADEVKPITCRHVVIYAHATWRTRVCMCAHVTSGLNIL